MPVDAPQHILQERRQVAEIVVRGAGIAREVLFGHDPGLKGEPWRIGRKRNEALRFEHHTHTGLHFLPDDIAIDTPLLIIEVLL
jgi:hypothetical protein